MIDTNDILDDACLVGNGGGGPKTGKGKGTAKGARAKKATAKKATAKKAPARGKKGPKVAPKRGRKKA